MRQTKKEEVITFKVDESLAEAMEGIRNRSEFIRRAILAALDSTCPLCQGTGILTPSQQQHWREFSEHHHVEQCETCNETHIVCDIKPGRGDHDT
jgi:metal-responsive CopG/Arc/MetJ family transcriptional regulator